MIYLCCLPLFLFSWYFNQVLYSSLFFTDILLYSQVHKKFPPLWVSILSFILLLPSPPPNPFCCEAACYTYIYQKDSYDNIIPKKELTESHSHLLSSIFFESFLCISQQKSQKNIIATFLHYCLLEVFFILICLLNSLVD